jgi:hypothetical protein
VTPSTGDDSRDQELVRRRLVAGYFVAGLLAAALVAAMIVAITAGDEGRSAPTSGGPFGTHYEGLEERRVAAGVPTMAEGGGEHFHPWIQIYANEEKVPVPSNIGIDPSQPPALMAGLHTHDESGTIHNEAGVGATLGDFFSIWGVPFSADRLGPFEASGSKSVRMWVDGEPSEEFGDLQLEDGQEIVIAYAPDDAPPPPAVGE